MDADGQAVDFGRIGSGTIIEFPRPTEPSARLRRALLELNAALAAQRAAVAEFRDAIGTLDSAVRRLGGSLGTFDQTLARVGAVASEAPE